MTHVTARHFPAGFLWGTATAAHQVEGNNRNNQWWAWEQIPGHIHQNQRSGLACNWWTPGGAEADLDRAQALGQNAHRLSVEWSRLEPSAGVFDPAAFARYREILTALRARGLSAMVTLHHFTNPLWFEAQGAWLNPRSVALFQRFVERVAGELGDLVDLWCTINEPNVVATLGYLVGEFPPGQRSPLAPFRVTRNLLLAHAAAYHAIHRQDSQAQVGLALQLRPFVPARPTARLDRWVARMQDYLFNQSLLTAIRDGVLRPPLGLGETVVALVDSSDFLGINFYTRELVHFDLRVPGDLFGRRSFSPTGEMSDLTSSGAPYSECVPDSLEQLLLQLTPCGKPIYITECGLPDADDDQRPRFLITHLAAVQRAIQAGAPVEGFFHWTLVDNFEWAEGWHLRFGLIELDTATQARQPRASAQTYADICRTNAITPAVVQRDAPEVFRQTFGEA
ncbi:MAG: family 1 glycosylhydrolase [Anaerolineae bacterium]